ncbi:MAG: F0F1 ATP synthase subunit B [Rhodospirillum sp.]|nr:F0F1 ATP synthase subunit B [Rhodospirillum sp.]MCF8491069.1 F0F1 ATP synthase subunit B [Rhodospirillum sp.]MCF8500213.1 F0F1 ATP synthase subunit B [Rhodospirillum sp.]
MISTALAATAELGAEAAEQAVNHGPFYSDPAFWVGVSFVVVVAFVWLKAKDKIVGGLDDRAAGIKSKIDEARKLREDAQALLAAYQRRQRDAMKEADDIVRHAKDEAERLRVKAEADLNAAIKRREQQALDRIAQAETQALAEVRAKAVDVAIATASKLMKDNMAAAEQNKLIDAAIVELPSKLH